MSDTAAMVFSRGETDYKRDELGDGAIIEFNLDGYRIECRVEDDPHRGKYLHVYAKDYAGGLGVFPIAGNVVHIQPVEFE